jgi:hypothetical protein
MDYYSAKFILNIFFNINWHNLIISLLCHFYEFGLLPTSTVQVFNKATVWTIFKTYLYRTSVTLFNYFPNKSCFLVRIDRFNCFNYRRVKGRCRCSPCRQGWFRAPKPSSIRIRHTPLPKHESLQY